MKTPIILCIPSEAGDHGVFLQTPWAERWSDVLRSPNVPESLQPCLRLAPGASVPHPVGAGVSIWVTELEQLEATAKQSGWRTVVFQPSQSASLDAWSRNRRGLAARHALKAGQSISADDVIAVADGAGLSETLLPSLIGQKLSYNLNAGEPITFGMIAREA